MNKILTQLTNNITDTDKIKLAMNPKCSAKILEELASDANPDIRECVATNPNTLLNALEALSRDWIEEVRLRLLYNPNATNEIIFFVLENDYPMKKYYAGNSSNIEILKYIAEEQICAEHFYYLVENPNVTIEILDKVLKSPCINDEIEEDVKSKIEELRLKGD